MAFPVLVPALSFALDDVARGLVAVDGSDQHRLVSLGRGCLAPDPCAPQWVPELGRNGVEVGLVKDADGFPDAYRIQASDGHESRWSVEIPFRTMGGSFWRGDLDANGVQDLVFVQWTGGSGSEPNARLYAVLFDRTAKPHPWLVSGDFAETESGLEDVVDLNRDGKAEVIVTSFDGARSVTRLYEARRCGWSELRGRRGSHRFPLRAPMETSQRSIRGAPHAVGISTVLE